MNDKETKNVRLLEEKRYRQQNIVAWVMFLNGILIAWYCTVFVEPKGEISGSVLGYIGECFSIGGAIWGFGLWVNKSIQQMRNDMKSYVSNNNNNGTA